MMAFDYICIMIQLEVVAFLLYSRRLIPWSSPTLTVRDSGAAMSMMDMFASATTMRTRDPAMYVIQLPTVF